MSLEAEVAAARPADETEDAGEDVAMSPPVAEKNGGDTPRARASWTDAMEKALWQHVQTRRHRGSVSKLLREFAERRGLSVHTTRAKYYQMLRGQEGGGTGRNWTAEEDRLLMDLVKEAGQGDGTLGVGFEQAAARLNRSPSAVRARYYRLAAEAGEGEAAAEPRRRGRRGRRPRAAGEAAPEGRAAGARGRRRGRRPGYPQQRVAAAGAPAPTPDGAGQELLPLLAAFLESAQHTPGVELRGFFGGLAQMARFARVGAEAGIDARRLAELEAEIRGLRRRLEELQSAVAEFEQRDEIGRIAALEEFLGRLRAMAAR